MTNLPSQSILAQVMEATWPPFASCRLGPWRLRDGAGGGKRVSAATLESDWQVADIALAVAAMPQGPLFMIRPQDGALDTALSDLGYRIVDPVLTYAAPIAQFAPPPRMTSFVHWPPLQIAVQLWAEAGIGPARLAVMDRAIGPKTALLARQGDRAVGVAYVALHGQVAMVHALEVSPPHRRQGSAQNLLAAAAHWSKAQGADTLGLAVTQSNQPARTLYERLGMVALGGYHYRQP
ncbi:MAG: GNAT family N-acetyltransferase [Alphaproteobacteria bacterium]|jgi:GNAT superfamily N-acetyltransferase